MRHTVAMGRHRRFLGGLLIAVAFIASAAAPASAKQPKLQAATYPDMTTFQCRTDAIPIHPGQNLNDFTVTRTCPNAVKVSGPGDASIFSAGSTAEGFITRFKPSMVEIKSDGSLVTPSVWDLHLHHVVWLKDGFGPTFASGEEKTIATMPQGYGLKVGATDDWGLNQMIHSLNASEGRSVYITWEIDWVPETNPKRTDIEGTRVQWLDVAGSPQVYPVFDAERGFDTNGDGKYVFPDEVPTDPSQPGYEEREKISDARMWTVPNGGATLVFGAGHLHPGGTRVDLRVARDGPDPGDVDGDTPEEIQRLFRSDAKYYEPAGAVSWDVAMEATPRDWRISLKPGDTVYVNATYNVKRASWYESMGIMPISWTKADDPLARDPFDQRDEVKAMYKAGGVLTHGRLCRRTSTGRPARTSTWPTRANSPAAARSPRAASTSTASSSPTAASRRSAASRPPRCARPWSPRARRSPSRTRTRFPACPTASRPGTASPRVARRATRTPGSATRSPTARSSSTPASSASGRSQLRGHDGLEPVHDAAADGEPLRERAGHHLHVLLPDPPGHARVDPGRVQPTLHADLDSAPWRNMMS